MPLTSLSHRLMRGVCFMTGIATALPAELGLARRAALAGLTVAALGMRRTSAAAWKEARPEGSLRGISIALARAGGQTVAVGVFRPINVWRARRGDADVHDEIWAVFLERIELKRPTAAATGRGDEATPPVTASCPDDTATAAGRRVRPAS